MDGYLLIPHVFTEHELSCSFLHGDKVDYPATKQFIDQIFMEKVKQHTGMTDPKYVKFRMSNNNNSTDASTFHGDIYNHTSTEIMPIYTCLCYFDDARIEVIPGSHRYHNRGWSISSYQKKVVLHIKRGDLLVFHSNLHHRGIGFGEGDRRLLQVFEVFPDQSTYDECLPRLTIVQTSSHPFMKEVINPILYKLAKHTELIDWLAFFHYILMFNGLVYKITMMDLAPWDKSGKYVTYEAARRAYLDETDYEDLNVNILCDRSVHTEQPCSFYLYAYLLYWIVSCVLIYYLYRWLRPKKRRLGRGRK
jgi:hypothetical protein